MPLSLKFGGAFAKNTGMMNYQASFCIALDADGHEIQESFRQCVEAIESVPEAQT